MTNPRTSPRAFSGKSTEKEVNVMLQILGAALDAAIIGAIKDALDD